MKIPKLFWHLRLYYDLKPDKSDRMLDFSRFWSSGIMGLYVIKVLALPSSSAILSDCYLCWLIEKKLSRVMSISTRKETMIYCTSIMPTSLIGWKNKRIYQRFILSTLIFYYSSWVLNQIYYLLRWIIWIKMLPGE